MVHAAIVPNEACYNALLHCASTAAARTDAFNILDLMRTRGLTPNVASYCSVINACSASNKPHMAFSVSRLLQSDAQTRCLSHHAV